MKPVSSAFWALSCAFLRSPVSAIRANPVIPAPKRLLLALEWGQGTTPEQDERIQAWVLDPSGVR